MPSGGSNSLLNLAKAAAYLDMPERRLRDNWRRWGILAYKAGRELRFRVRELESWLESNREPLKQSPIPLRAGRVSLWVG